MIIIILMLPLALLAQTITESRSALVYSLPKTELMVHASVEKITETPGAFFQYSERFLAENHVIVRKRVYYRLKTLTVLTRTVPHKERTFSIIPAKKSLTAFISVNDQGILCGINVPPVNANKDVEFIGDNQRKNDNKPLKLIPLNEEYMFAGSTAKMAEGAAKQIYRIRENRMDLLAGDVEHVPSDGTSMKTMIEQMERQEKQLTELFTGTIAVEELSQNIIYSPVGATKDQVLFRFSSFDGIVDADDLSGEPYYISVDYDSLKIENNDQRKKKKPKEEVFSVLPVNANVQIDDGKRTFFNQDLVFPQLGALVSIPLETMGKNGKAYVSPETGRLLSVEQGK